MIEQFLKIALIGGEPILYLLIFLSFLSIAVVIERYVFFFRYRLDIGEFASKLVDKLNADDFESALAMTDSLRAAEAAVVGEGLRNFDKGEVVANELMESMALKQQQSLDRGLIILGTIGSNAPFIGLLGTVLGIIKAFHDLSANAQGGPSVVMAGIAEALVATAVGLLVAIPAVIFFNYFKNRQKRILSNVNQIQRTLIAFIAENRSTSPSDGSSN